MPAILGPMPKFNLRPRARRWFWSGLAILLLNGAAGLAPGDASVFHIFKGKDLVGSIQAERVASGGHVRYIVTSYSMVDVVSRHVVRTAMMADYNGGVLTSCHTVTHVNKGLRDSSSMSFRSGVAYCYVHPGKAFQRADAPAWTTARMYFEEPVGRSWVFVESIMQDCPLLHTGPGSYALTIPGKSVNHYTYQGGVLQEVLVDRSLFNLVFKRA